MKITKIERLNNGNVLFFNVNQSGVETLVKGFHPFAGITKKHGKEIEVSQQNGSDSLTFDWDDVQTLTNNQNPILFPSSKDELYKLLFEEFFFTSTNPSPMLIESGTISIFAGATAPSGYAFCEGQVLNIVSFPDLFAAIGSIYGGDGINNFALPDLRGRTVIQAGQGTGLSAYNLADAGGSESVVLDVTQMPEHRHEVRAVQAVGNSNNPTDNLLSNTGAFDNEYSDQNPDTTMKNRMLSKEGGNLPHENRAPFLALNYMIKL